MSIKSVCVFCGSTKKKPLEQCDSCGKAPEKRRDCIHSIILSIDSNAEANNFIDEEEFKRKSEVVRNQQALLFDKSIYSLAEKHYAEVTEVSDKMLMLYLLKLSVPMLLTFVLMGYLFLT